MLKIDPEFKSLIYPLTKDEYEQLEQNILKRTCRDALVIWNGILIDGHNRYEICTKHGLEYKTTEVQLDSREDAIVWIIENQLGRRNLEIHQRVELALKKEEAVKKKAKESQIRKPDFVLVQGPKQKDKIHTDKELGKIAGVCAKTIQRARVIKEEGTLEQKEQFRTGEKKIRVIYDEIRHPKTEEPEANEEAAEETKEPPVEEKLLEPQIDPNKRKCSICGSTKDLSEMSGSMCKPCKTYIETQRKKGVDIDIKKLQAIPFDFDKLSANVIDNGITEDIDLQPIEIEIIDLLETFHISINKFAHMNDLKNSLNKTKLIESISRVEANIQKIRSILGA